MTASAPPAALTRARGARVAPRADATVSSEARRRTLHIVAADPDPAARDFYRTALPRLGHEVQLVATGPDLVQACRLLVPDLVLVATHLPGLDGLAAADAVCRERPVPVVLTDDSFDLPAMARAAASEWVMGCLPWPVGEGALGAAVALAARRFEQAQELREDAAELRQALEDRKLIERAKGTVMRRLGVGEESAFGRMQALASQTNRKLAEVAQHVLAAEETFARLDGAV